MMATVKKINNLGNTKDGQCLKKGSSSGGSIIGNIKDKNKLEKVALLRKSCVQY